MELVQQKTQLVLVIGQNVPQEIIKVCIDYRFVLCIDFHLFRLVVLGIVGRKDEAEVVNKRLYGQKPFVTLDIVDEQVKTLLLR